MIPITRSKNFSVYSAEGYFICRATAWNGDWIGGIATPGTSDNMNTYSFIRYASGGADTVIKKLGRPEVKTKIVYGNGSFDAGGTVLFAGIQNAALHIMTYATKYGHSSNYNASCSYSGSIITYGQGATGDVSGIDSYSMTIIYAIE